MTHRSQLRSCVCRVWSSYILLKHSCADTQWQLGMSNGALFGVPIPQQYEAVGATMQDAIEQAVKESQENGVNKRGKEATPWLLKRVSELTQGKSLVSNIALIQNTASVGK
jgi:pseudouridine-5'-phosphate glycosidase/pseudouridine kinase